MNQKISLLVEFELRAMDEKELAEASEGSLSDTEDMEPDGDVDAGQFAEMVESTLALDDTKTELFAGSGVFMVVESVRAKPSNE